MPAVGQFDSSYSALCGLSSIVDNVQCLLPSYRLLLEEEVWIYHDRHLDLYMVDLVNLMGQY